MKSDCKTNRTKFFTVNLNYKDKKNIETITITSIQRIYIFFNIRCGSYKAFFPQMKQKEKLHCEHCKCVCEREGERMSQLCMYVKDSRLSKWIPELNEHQVQCKFRQCILKSTLSTLRAHGKAIARKSPI